MKRVLEAIAERMIAAEEVGVTARDLAVADLRKLIRLCSAPTTLRSFPRTHKVDAR